MNLNRGLAIKIVYSVEMCEDTIRYFYQGGIFRSVKEKDNNQIEDRNKKVYFELPNTNYWVEGIIIAKNSDSTELLIKYKIIIDLNKQQKNG